MGIVTCENVTKVYRNQRVLSVDSLQIKENALTGLIGRNGAGKTTLLKLIAGFNRPTAGDVCVFGRNPFDNLQVSANSIFIDDQLEFAAEFMLEDILREMGRFYPNWDQELAESLCHYFKLYRNQYPVHLSKGKRSTFHMIIGLCANVRLTILDEPITGMDVAVRKDFYRVLLKNYLANPRTIIVSSHHLNEMEDLLEDIILLDDGEIVFHMLMDDVREYAVGITGDAQQLSDWLADKEVLYKETTGKGMYAAVRGDFSSEEIAQLGFTLSVVTPSDLAIYLTNKSVGGIDDVFGE